MIPLSLRTSTNGMLKRRCKPVLLSLDLFDEGDEFQVMDEVFPGLTVAPEGMSQGEWCAVELERFLKSRGLLVQSGKPVAIFPKFMAAVTAMLLLNADGEDQHVDGDGTDHGSFIEDEIAYAVDHFGGCWWNSRNVVEVGYWQPDGTFRPVIKNLKTLAYPLDSDPFENSEVPERMPPDL